MLDKIGFIVTVFLLCSCSLLALIGVAWVAISLVCTTTANGFIGWIFQPWYVAGLGSLALIMTACICSLKEVE